MQLNKSTLKLIRSLHQAKFRKQRRLFTAEGIKTVNDLFNYGYKLQYLIISDETKNVDYLIPHAEYYVVKRQIMEQISALTTPPGILGVFELPEITISEQPSTNRWSLILDGIKDPGNMGTIIRTAHWFGIKDLYLANHCVDVFSPKVVQSSMGSLGAVRIKKIENIEQWASKAKQIKYALYATTLLGKPIHQCKDTQPGGIIIGSESHGIDPLWRNCIKESLFIPSLSNNPPDSLNVAVSTGIILYYLCNSEIK